MNNYMVFETLMTEYTKKDQELVANTIFEACSKEKCFGTFTLSKNRKFKFEVKDNYITVEHSIYRVPMIFNIESAKKLVVLFKTFINTNILDVNKRARLINQIILLL